MEAQAGALGQWYFSAPSGSAIGLQTGGGRPCGASWRSAQVSLPTSAPGRCDWWPVFRPRNLTPSGTLGHAVLADTGHHAGGYLQDKVLEMSLVSCGKTTGFRPITGPLLIAALTFGGSLLLCAL